MRLLIAAPFLLVLISFVLSNRMQVEIGIWPTGVAWQVPLSIAVLVAAGMAFVIGALLVWVNEIGQRRRARRAEATIRLLEEQVQELKARLAPPSIPPPSG
ncbi:MAG: lipopolysaccharide assembly protein LapA domain-containing protein [Acetobacteraceae bacterium]